MPDEESYTEAPPGSEPPPFSRRQHFAEVVAAVESEARDSDAPPFSEFVPADPMTRQADLLAELRPRARRAREADLSQGGGGTSRGKVIQRKAFNAVLRVAAPLRTELEYTLDYLDALEVAYQTAVTQVGELRERIEALEASLGGEAGSDPVGS